MLEINTKEDILIPFKKAGEPGWGKNTGIIIQSLNENWEHESAPSISTEEIEELERRIGTVLPEGLKLFYLNFGLADIGEQLQDFETIEWLKDIWPQNETPYYGPDYSEEDKKLLPFLVTFSDYLGNGNMFCFHSETHEIYYFDHEDSPYLYRMFTSVDEYLAGCLISAQGDLFGSGTSQEQVEKWTEEIISNLYGEEILRKWMY